MYKREANLNVSINRAVEECIQEGILKEVLLLHKAEVIELILTEFNKELYERDLKEDAREEGLAEGRAEGRAEGFAEGRTEVLLSLVRKGRLTVEEAAEEANMGIAAFKELLNK